MQTTDCCCKAQPLPKYVLVLTVLAMNSQQAGSKRGRGLAAEQHRSELCFQADSCAAATRRVCFNFRSADRGMHPMNEQAGIVEGIPVLPVLARPAHSSGAEASQREGGGTGPSGPDSEMVRQPTPMQQQQAPMQVRTPAALCMHSLAVRLLVACQRSTSYIIRLLVVLHAPSAAAYPCAALAGACMAVHCRLNSVPASTIN
jgi:hypothetical protein